MVKNFTFLGLLALFITLTGCRNNATKISDEEKGHFKIVFSDLMSSTQDNSPASRTFWDESSTAGEACEQTLNNVSIFVYENSKDVCVYRRNFTTHEISKKTAIFSLPEGSYEHSAAYDFIAVANYKVTDITAGETYQPKRAELEKILQSDLKAYMGITAATPPASTYYASEFAKLYPAGADAVALRTGGTDGEGFVMSGRTLNVTTPSGDSPRKVGIHINRVASKIEVKAAATAQFKTTYIDTYGSTFHIDEIQISNLPSASLLLDSLIVASNLTVINIGQTPKVVTTDKLDAASALFYSFENKVKSTTVAAIPELRVCATYDFDGNAATVDDVTKIVYKKSLALGGGGAILRNTRYRINVQINGLTPQEIITTITIADWKTVATEEISFGN